MRTALRALAVAGLAGVAGLTGCATMTATGEVPEATGFGGSGIDLAAAEAACREAADATGQGNLNWVEEVRYTSETTARLRFDRLGWFRADALCYYDLGSGAASIR